MSTNLTTAEHLSSLASAVKGKLNVLDTLPATVNGGLWLEGGGSVPIIKMYYGGNAFKITPELVIKATPTLTVGTTNFNLRTDPNTTTITYNGDGNLYLFDFTDGAQATISGATLTVADYKGTFKVGATEGTNYAAATPVTVTVTATATGTAPGTTPQGNEIVTLDVLTEDTETTVIIRKLCYQGLEDQYNMLYYLSEQIQAELEGLVDTSNNFDVVTVQLVGNIVPDYSVTINYSAPDVIFDDGWNYYGIFTKDEAVEDYMLIEAVGQSNGSVTFELPVEFIEAHLDTSPMTMLVMPALE